MLEKELIEKCIKGNNKAQELLYNTYARSMKGVCVRYTKSYSEAEDVFQDAFIKVFDKLPNYDFKGSFEGWIRRIVVNSAIDYHRKNLKTKFHVEIDDEIEFEHEEQSFEHQFQADDLMKVLEKLPAGYKMVFNMYAIEGYSHKEIAEELKINEGTSKSQLSKARKYIQKLLVELKEYDYAK
jgi:RNA polymerase sigma factor (sigma-70 family)